MDDWVRIAALGDVPGGAAIEVAASGRIFAVYNVDGQIHVMDGICPHAGGPLGKGTLTGNIITCPWHGWQFDVTTGRHCLTETIGNTSFPVRIEAGEVFVKLD